MPEIVLLCEKSDVIFLQEIWLAPDELNILNNIHSDFYGRGVSAMEPTRGILAGRPHGGVAILYRKSLAKFIKVDSVDDDKRLMEFKFKHREEEIFLLNSYLPYCCYPNLDDFLNYLSIIDSYLKLHTFSAALGDFNSDVGRSCKHLFGDHLIDFCDREGYIISDVVLHNDDNAFTFYSEAHDTVSRLDHLITNANSHFLVDNVNIDYSFVTSDHFPVSFDLKISNICTEQIEDDTAAPSDNHGRIDWQQASDDDIEAYRLNTRVKLKEIPLPYDLLLCKDDNCTDPNHTTDIDNMYDNIINSLHGACDNYEKPSKHKSTVIGWNEYCRAAHDEARESFLLWRANNSPRHGVYFDLMKKSRAYFKLVL